MNLEENIRDQILKALETSKDVEMPSAPLLNEWAKSGPMRDHELTHKLQEFSEYNDIDYVWIFPEGIYSGQAILRFWKKGKRKMLKEVKEDDALRETGIKTEVGQDSGSNEGSGG